MDPDDISVTDETDDQPVGSSQPQTPDVASIVAQTTEAVFAKLAPLLQRNEPQQPARPPAPRDRFLGALKADLGIEDDDDVERYAKARAYELLQDEYGDDPAVRKAIQGRVESARPIEGIASMKRELRDFMQKIEGRFSEQEQSKKRAEEAAAYKRLAAEGQLSDKFPNLFRKGRPSQAALKIFDRFHDVDQLRAALEVAEEIAAEQQPRRPSLGSGMGGGRATQAPKPSKFLAGADYDNEIRKIYEEMN